MKWKTQAGNFITNQKVKVYLCLLEYSATKIVTWECNVDDSSESRYATIPGRDILTILGLYFKFTNNVIK